MRGEVGAAEARAENESRGHRQADPLHAPKIVGLEAHRVRGRLLGVLRSETDVKDVPIEVF